MWLFYSSSAEDLFRSNYVRSSVSEVSLTQFSINSPTNLAPGSPKLL
jgi:hypothetical protein